MMTAHMGIAILVNTVFIQATGKSVFTEDTKKTSSAQTEKGEPMRLIDADESLKHIFPRRTESDYQKGIAVGMTMAKVAINEQPTIDAEPVRHGKWIKHKDYPGLAYLCSECGRFTTERSHYCPDCGAKMDGERRTDEG